MSEDSFQHRPHEPVSIQRPRHRSPAGAYLARHIDLAAWLLVSAVFVVSLRLSADYIAGSLYLAAILLAMWAPDGRLALQIAGLSTLLVATRVFLKPEGLPIGPILFNRAALILMFWITAFGIRNFRRSESARERGEARTQEYLGIVNVAVLVLDAAGRIVLVNRYGVELLGLAAVPAAGTPWIETFVPHEDQAAWRAALAGADAAGREGTPHVSRVVRRGGPMQVVAWKTVALHNAAGEFSGTLSSGDEITRRLEIEDALSRSLRELSDLKYALDQSAIVATTERAGRHHVRQRQVLRDLEVFARGAHRPESPHHQLGPAPDGVLPGSLSHDRERPRLARRDPQPREGRLVLLGRHDHRAVPRRARQAVSVHRDPQRHHGAQAVRGDAARQTALAQLGKMAAVVAHEVRNPLAGIRGALQVIGQRLDPASRERQVVTEIMARIDTLNDIVQDLLLFARPRLPVLQRVAVASLAQDTISLLREDPALESVSVVVATNHVVVARRPGTAEDRPAEPADQRRAGDGGPRRARNRGGDRGRVARAAGVRPGARHSRRSAGTALRAVLHDEASRHRTRDLPRRGGSSSRTVAPSSWNARPAAAPSAVIRLPAVAPRATTEASG